MAVNPKPVFLLAGHGIRRGGRDPMIAEIIAATGVQHPRAAYLGSASGDNQPFFLMMSALLRASGCGPVKMARTVGKRVDINACNAVLYDADLVFVSGGDVEEGMRVLEEKQLVKELGELYLQGKVFCGASAGSIMLAREWVRWDNPEDDSSASLFKCLAFADMLCDTHGESDEWEELQVALRLSHEGTIGYGIRSGSGLAWHPDGQIRVIGGVIDTFARNDGQVVRGVSL